MSTSSRPASVPPFRVRPPAPIRPPVLASDILLEEVAPRFPARHAIRVALGAVTAAFIGGAILACGGSAGAPGALLGSLIVASMAAIGALAPLSYSGRAWVALAAGGAPLVLGGLRAGPLARLGDGGTGPACAAVAMATLLPAALVFRARYRVFSGARAILAGALAASMPEVILSIARAADAGAPVADRILGGLRVTSALAATLGFMGPETSAACAQWAACVLGAVVAESGWRAADAAWSGRGSDTLSLTAASLGSLLASTLVALALFQLLAAALSGRARAVDVHRPADGSRSSGRSRPSRPSEPGMADGP